MDSVNSTTFIKRPPFMTDFQEKFLYTKELLSGRLFLGYYQERRHVAILKDYRLAKQMSKDVVILNSEETELHQDINKLKKKWAGVTEVKWVGITVPEEFGFPDAYCFWVKLTNLAFGHYWFQIKHVKLFDEEILLQLKCIRKFQAPHPTILQSTQKEVPEARDRKLEKSATTNSPSGEYKLDLDPSKAFKSFQSSCRSTIQIIQPLLTWKNFFTVIRTIVAVVIVFIMGTISFISHLGEFVLKLIREISFLVNAFTPIAIQLIDFLSKVVGGFYILLAGMFHRQHNHHNQLHRNQNVYSIPYSEVIKPSSQMPATDWRERNRILRQELLNDKSQFRN